MSIHFSALARFGGETIGEVNVRDPWVAGNHVSYDVTLSYSDWQNALADFQEQAAELYVTLASYLGE
jgi:hypothetical protein